MDRRRARPGALHLPYRPSSFANRVAAAALRRHLIYPRLTSADPAKPADAQASPARGPASRPISAIPFAYGKDPVSRPFAIDPLDCGCTQCIVGTYVPLAEATDGQVAAMLCGDLDNHTGLTFTIAVVYELDPGQSLAQAQPIEVSVRAADRTWAVDPYLLRLGALGGEGGRS